MIRNISVFLLFVLVVALWGRALQARFSDLDISTSPNPVVVELFTSQSCSSCPPADAVLAELSGRDNIIALGCHVTYWDHLNWRDPQSQEFCTERQRHYAQFRNSRRTYTPQMIVNGTDEFVGSRRDTASSVIARAQFQNTVQSVGIRKSIQGKFHLDLPEIERNGKRYGIWVFGYKSQHDQDIPSGENRGRSVTYVNAAQSQTYIGAWDGRAEKREVKIPLDQNIDGIIVIIQNRDFGPITAAGKLVF